MRLTMGRKLNLSHLSPEECEHILDVVHKDFNLRFLEKERLRQIEEDVNEDLTKYSILSKSHVFNEKSCICCFVRFFILFNPKFLCDVCRFYVCKKCIVIDEEKKRCCRACLRLRQFKKQSNDWFYSSVEQKFKRCGSSKVIRSLYKRHFVGDGSSTLTLMSHSDSAPVAGTKGWRSTEEEDGPPYGASLPKSFTLTTGVECHCEDSPCPHRLPCQTDSGEEAGRLERLSGCPQMVASEDQRDIHHTDAETGILQSTSDRSRNSDDVTSQGEWSKNETSLVKRDSCIQTENQSELTETGTMTFSGTASRCFNGFDGMSAVSTEGQELDPRFVARPHNIRVLEGEPLIVDCKVAGTEPLDVLWFCSRNQVQQIEEGDRTELRRHGDTFSLSIFGADQSDGLEYMCIAVNVHGQCAQGFTATVDENGHSWKTPEFINLLDNIEISPEGSDAVLQCSLSAYPEPKVTWYKNKKKITHGGRYSADKDVSGGSLRYTLRVEKVKPEDSGAYTAVARNVAGESSYTLQLLVQPTSSSERRTVVADSPPLSRNADDLMRLAESVSRTHGRYTTTATRMLRSADAMSSMQSQLDEMDRALEDLEGEVLDVLSDEDVDDDDDDDDEDSANNNNGKIGLDELDEMKSSAEAVGLVTTAALQLLSSAKEIAMEKLRDKTRVEEQEELDQEDDERKKKKVPTATLR